MLPGLSSLYAQPQCHAQFQHYSLVGQPDSVHFYPTQNGATARYFWSFGDGTYSHNRDPWHTYALPGSYVACLTVTDSTSAGTCTDTWCDSVIVAAPLPPTCNAHFQYYANPHNADSLHFYPDQTQSSRTAYYHWSFGDGTFSQNRDQWHLYAQPGTYVACLTVTDTTSTGTCSDTWCDSVYVVVPPPPSCDAHYQFYALTGYPDSLHFYAAQSTTTTHYLWSFGDGTWGHTRDPWHRYAQTGTYVVCLTVTDSTSAGTCTDNWCDSVIVAAAQAPLCDASFQYYANPHNADSLHFYSGGRNNASAHFFWSFGDGTYSQNRDPWHLYAQPGMYVVCLTVTDTTTAGVCSDTQCDTVYVVVPPPPSCDAHFTHYALTSYPDSVHFYPMQTQNSPTARYFWSFGDGTFGHTRDPWHRYAQTGSYSVCLTVTDTTSAGTCSATWCDSVIVAGVQGPICNAHFQYYTNPHNADSLHFYVGQTQSSATAHYFWSFGDGTYGHTRDPWHLYAQNGTYVVCLTVTDTTSAGVCSDTWCDSVAVTTPPPPTCSAHFIHYSLPNSPDSVHFYPDQMQSRTTARYFWSFGDGTYSHNRDPWHTYAQSGTYTVCLTVTDSTAYGVCTDTWCDYSMVVPLVQIYPNPVTNVVSITLAGCEHFLTLQIHDEKGRVVHREQVGDGTTTVRMEGLSTGSYFYQLTDGDNVIATGKFMLMKAQ